jgi:hypothetical protein
VREAATVVGAAVPNIQTPLASALLLANATNGSAASFEQLMAPSVGPKLRFVSASLWSVTGAEPRLLAEVGASPQAGGVTPAGTLGALQKAVGAKTVMINNMLGSTTRQLGYAYSPDAKGKYLVYAEAAFPKSRRANVDSNSAFADLDYALYVGPSASPQELIASSTGGALPSGQRASEAVPFGNTHLLLVMTAKTELGGDLLARLPWSLAAGGLVLTLAGAFLVERLLRRRDYAETLARENDLLYKEQRTVAQTLQHSLLPDSLPSIEGLELASRYVAGVEGIDIGGDWYDVIDLDANHVVFVVGDVSGRGLRAATTMAELRYAVRAYAFQGDAPEAILSKVAQLIDVGRDGHFATAICGVIDVSAHRVTVANAGHPNPLLVSREAAAFAVTDVGAPLGVSGAAPYRATTMSIPANATLLVFTDGLVERRDENIDAGLERLRVASLDPSGSVEDLLTRILIQAIPIGSADDTAILGIRWQN